MKLFGFIGIAATAILLFSCQQDPALPLPANDPLANDPREIYIGNYDMTITRSSWTYMSQTTTETITNYTGSVSIDSSTTDRIAIEYGPGDTIRVVPDNTGHFAIGSYPNSSGYIVTSSGAMVLDFTYSRSPSHDIHYFIGAQRNP